MVEGEWLKNNNMDRCQKCQKEITNDNSYSLDKNEKDNFLRPIGIIHLCETCFKNIAFFKINVSIRNFIKNNS